MGQVIQFSRVSPPREREEMSAPRYCCTRCDSERFNLLETGLVKCAQCGAVMTNLGVLPLELSQRG